MLVNNIDSWLTDGVKTIDPWVLNSFPSTDSLSAIAIRKKDDLNNTEYITLTNPDPGTYQLFLKSGVLKDSEQKVSIAWWLNENKPFNWDFPIGGDLIEGGEKNLLVWEAKTGQLGNLSLQTNNGDWQLIQSNIDLNNYFYWLAPDTLAKAKLKMTIGQDEFLSDEFTISPKMNVRSAFNCSDSVGLTWNSIKNAVAYELYTMGPVTLEPVLVSNDTLIVLPQSADKFYAVAPVFSGTAGIKSETINSTQQGVYCYINLFTADRLSAKEVRVQLQLSSQYLIDRIIFFKTVKGVRGIFQTIESGASLSIEFYDLDLSPGLMSYQAEIVFENGINIFSDVVEIPVEEKDKAIIYPNPISDSDYLTILSSGDGSNFQILDVYGRTLIEKEIHIVADAIDVETLPPGIYFYRLVSAGRITDTGRFIRN